MVVDVYITEDCIYINDNGYLTVVPKPDNFTPGSFTAPGLSTSKEGLPPAWYIYLGKYLCSANNKGGNTLTRCTSQPHTNV